MNCVPGLQVVLKTARNDCISMLAANNHPVKGLVEQTYGVHACAQSILACLTKCFTVFVNNITATSRINKPYIVIS